jgi:ribosomal protein S18 acetylase RimI-like enzyme
MDCSHIQLRQGHEALALDQPLDQTLDQLVALFDLAAFWAKRRRREDLATAIRHSNPVVTAWDGDRLIGFARATSDGVYRATVWDVVVHPNFQGAGIGRKLVQTVLSHPFVCPVERVYLMTTNQQRFYEKIGFELNPSTTLVLHNHPLESLEDPARSHFVVLENG